MKIICLHFPPSFLPVYIPKTYVITMLEDPSWIFAELSGEWGDREMHTVTFSSVVAVGGLVGGV